MPNIDWKGLQELMFILEYKLNQSEDVIMKMPYRIVKKRYDQYIYFQEETAKSYKTKARDIRKK